MAEPTALLRTTARAFLDTLGQAGRAAAVAPFAAADRTEWTYLPGPRPGIAVGDLTDAARDGLEELLRVTLSARGAERTRQVMHLDDILREVERSVGRSGWERRSSDRYWVRVLGDPDDEVWAWHLGGHHVGVHATVVDGTLAITPSFLGANPALVRGGPHAGLQVLREEEQLARDVLAGSGRGPAPGGGRVAGRARRHRHPARPRCRSRPGPGGAAPRRTGRRAGATAPGAGTPVPRPGTGAGGRRGVGRDRGRRAWARSPSRGPGPRSRGSAHYYAVRGETFLIEYDNTQDGANHAHTVWRDLQRDWGTDLLAEHHAAAHG